MRGLPLISKIPILGRLFAANEKEINETDVIVALSPHILRSIDITPQDEEMLWLGIDSQQQQPGFRQYTPIPVPQPLPPTIEEDVPEDDQEDPDADEEDLEEDEEE